MNNEHSLSQYSTEEILFVFALQSEAAEEFKICNCLFTGVGKLNAAYTLAKYLEHKKPSLIINLGSAGSSFFKKGEVVCCTKFIQRDMDARGLGFQQYETPFANIPVVLEYGTSLPELQQVICGSGDTFEMNHCCNDYNVVDMEVYALAFIAMKENIPFLCLKYISDGADGVAADDWNIHVHKAAKAFAAILF